MKKILIVLSLMLVVWCLDAQEIPQMISFQGKLLEDGQPVNATKEIIFTIGDWSETHNVSVSNGIYPVTLGSINPIPVSLFTENSSAILSISVEGVNLTPDTEILSSPYAFKSEESANADKLNGEIPEYYLGIESINDQTGDENGNLIISGSTNIEITQENNVITITAVNVGSGTVTQINTAGGLTGGPITDEGTIIIEDGGVTEIKLANNSVTSNKIQDGTILPIDFAFIPATLPIDGADIVDNSIPASKLNFTPGDVTGVNGNSGITVNNSGGPVPEVIISNGGVTNSHLGSDCVTSNKIQNLTITGSDIANNTITSNEIQDGTITTSDLNFTPATLPLNGSNIVDNSIPEVKLSFTPGDITGVNEGSGIDISSSGGPIPTVSIESGGVTNSHLGTNCVTSNKIQDGTIVGNDIANNTIGTAKLNFTPGDVTGVNEGSGIDVSSSGGPTPTVSIESGGVTNSHLGSNCVTSAKIQNGTITTSDLNFTPLTNPHSGNFTATGAIKAGSPSSSSGNGDVVADDDIIADDDVKAGDDVSADGGIVAYGGSIICLSSYIVTGNPYTSSYGTGDIVADDDLISDDDVVAGDDILAGGVKYFVIDHPTDDSKFIMYACIEGPEAAAYNRGTAKLINGEVWIKFEEHFSLIINSNTVTIQVTPLSAISKGLAIVEKNKSGFKIKELNNGKGNYEVDYFVQAVRKGYEDLKPVRNKSEIDFRFDGSKKLNISNDD